MKFDIQKFLSSFLIVITTFSMIVPSGFAAPSLAVTGLPLDTNETLSDGFCWNASTFGGFNYQINKNKEYASENWIGERLQYIEKDGQDKLGKNNPGNHTIGEGELVYSTRPVSSKYELVSDLELNANTTPKKLGGMFYYKLPWFGKPYVTVGNDSTWLSNLVFSQNSSEKKNLKAGESWDLGKNYSLNVNQVDVDGKKVWFSLSKNGTELESGIVNTDGTLADKTFVATADIGGGSDQIYFITYVDSVFTSAFSSFAVFKYTWLIDRDDLIHIDSGNEYQGFKVKEASKSGIVLENNRSITIDLDKDEKTYFTDSWYFQTSDEGKGSSSPEGYIIYPAKELKAPGNYTLRGIPLDTNETPSNGFIWNATTFSGFNYQVNKNKDYVAAKNWVGERLQYVEKDGQNELGKGNPGNHVIGEGELVYSTRPVSTKFDLVSDLGLNANTSTKKFGGMFFYKLPWFGKQYVTVGNDSTWLANQVISQSSSEKKELKAGESWILGKNYSLVANQVDVDGKKVWFSLCKNGREIDSGVVNTDGPLADRIFTATADIGGGSDQLYFITYVDSVFSSSDSSFAVFKYTWLIDKDDLMHIQSGDKYQGFEVKKASSNEIVLENSNAITLTLDKDVKNYFTDSWYFQTSDEGKGSTSPLGYVICPAADITVDSKAGGGPGKNTASTDASNPVQANVTNKTNITNETNITSEMNGINETQNTTIFAMPSNESSSGPKIQSSFEDSKNKSTQSAKAGEASSVKTPGFEIFVSILGFGLSQAYLRRKK